MLAEHYDAVGAALIGAIEHFAGDAFTPKVKAAWTEAYAIVANAMRTAAAAERGPPPGWAGWPVTSAWAGTSPGSPCRPARPSRTGRAST